MTIGHFGAKERAEAKRMLTAMRQAAKTGDFDEWFGAHNACHAVGTAAAGEAMQRQLRAFADRTTRYIRIYQLSEPNSWQTAGDAEHAAILEALIADDERGALTEMAHHLERTALRVLADCAPDFTPVAVPHAVALIDRQSPVARSPVAQSPVAQSPVARSPVVQPPGAEASASDTSGAGVSGAEASGSLVAAELRSLPETADSTG